MSGRFKQRREGLTSCPGAYLPHPPLSPSLNPPHPPAWGRVLCIVSKVRASVCLSPTFVRCAVIIPHIIICFPGTSTQSVTLPADCRVPSFLFIYIFLLLLMCRRYTCNPALRRVDECCICDSIGFFFLNFFKLKYMFHQNKVPESHITNKCASLIVFSGEKTSVGVFFGSAETEKVKCALILILTICLSPFLCTII